MYCFFDPDLYKALKIKAAQCEKSLSELKEKRAGYSEENEHSNSAGET